MKLFSGNPNKVIVSRAEVATFRAQFPCSNLRDRSYWFEFDAQNGDLIDTDVPEHDDGAGAVALADDASKFWEANSDAPGAALRASMRR